MRKATLTTGLFLLWSFIVVGFFIAEEKLKKPPVHRGSAASIEGYMAQRLRDAVTQRRLGCATMALVQNGKIVAEHGFGIANPETKAPAKTNQTLFLLSSLSKAVTAWGIMKLVQDGKLSLDEPVMQHLKRWRFPGSETYRDKVTARQLLCHTAGLADGYGHSGFLPGEKIQSIEESLNLPKDANTGTGHAAVIVTEPGTVMSYSSAGYAVLQLLIEEITGKPFQTYMREAILLPLGMKQSDYDVDAVIAAGRQLDLAPNYDLALQPNPHRRYTNMAGVSLRSTAHDLAQLVTAYHNENPVLTKETLQQMATPQPGTSQSWGLGHTLYTENNAGGYVIGHGGGAFPASGAEMRLNPATGDGMVLLATGTQGLISELSDAWTYWETGKKAFDIRNIVHKRLVHALAAIVLGATAIIIWHTRKRFPKT
jgi:CubicO group peptidase (beta-lactamase class C family)